MGLFSALKAWLQRRAAVREGGVILTLAAGFPVGCRQLAPGLAAHVSASGAVLRLVFEKPGEYELNLGPALYLSDRVEPTDPHGRFIDLGTTAP